ncbi:hypothetical protein SBF1_830011 [Candidatus Desulfosporosinus infrequens]|uniref:Uncharacterized protein n=1 Tax=Candidatus Desulfosporosinus infrequens TaxID=2043169 RepID=A0A2U3LU45_9FIRM|nr:hypothetical protein SBF1_830011 [Candidatus Desulfosporosinus infrequens]
MTLLMLRKLNRMYALFCLTIMMLRIINIQRLNENIMNRGGKNRYESLPPFTTEKSFLISSGLFETVTEETKSKAAEAARCICS